MFDGFILINECNPFKGEKLNLNIRRNLHLHVYDINMLNLSRLYNFIIQLIINFHELFLVNKRNHTSHLKKKTAHKDTFVKLERYNILSYLAQI